MAQRKNKKAEFVLWMGPLLDALRELGDSGSPREVSDLIATKLKIPDEKKEELMESVTPKGKDGGIDGFGTLQLNPFVSFKIIFQCKRYQGTVSRANVGDLRNAMIGRADKGIMITTGNFSEDTKREAVRDGAPPIELIDAEMLIDMMEKEEIGLKPKTVFKELLSSKIKEHSRSIEPVSSEKQLKSIAEMILEANHKIKEHNEIVTNYQTERNVLIRSVWKYLVEEFKEEIKKHIRKISGLQEGIDCLAEDIDKKRKQWTGLNDEIKKLTKNVTSIQPTIDQINATLKAYGFVNFEIVPSQEDKNHYQIKGRTGHLLSQL